MRRLGQLPGISSSAEAVCSYQRLHTSFLLFWAAFHRENVISVVQPRLLVPESCSKPDQYDIESMR
jgi:hypothetical protein